MGCHKSTPARFRPCQGWVRVVGFDAIGVRLLAMRGEVTIAEVEDRGGPKLYTSFAAMLAANKIKLGRRNRAVEPQ